MTSGRRRALINTDDGPGRPTAALLLTGGASRRMGQDKATLMIGGRRLADRTAALLHQVAAPVLEVGPGYTSLPRTQEEPPGSGPLAALAAGAQALRQLHHEGSVLVVATDLARLTEDFLRTLAGHPVPSVDHCVVPRDARGRAQPLSARYSPAALEVAAELVAEGHRAMGALLERVPVIWLEADSPDVLLDVDTPADLAAVQHAPPGGPRP